MKFFPRLSAIAALILLATASSSFAEGQKNRNCIGNVVCELDGRSYHVLPPDNWDGVSTLPILVHFHGWGRQGPVPINHKHIGGATRKHGVLLIAPNGLGKSWSFWRPDSRDTEFALDVLEDVAKKLPNRHLSHHGLRLFVGKLHGMAIFLRSRKQSFSSIWHIRHAL